MDLFSAPNTKHETPTFTTNICFRLSRFPKYAYDQLSNLHTVN